MINLIKVSTLDHSNLQPYRTLRRPLEHQRQGIFVAEGEKVLRRLVESNLQIVSVLLTPEWLEQYRKILEAKPERLDVFVAEKKLLEGIVGFHLHQGIMAVGKIPNPATLDQVLASNRRPYFLAAVDGLTNAENLGVLVRNCVAFGVQAFLVGETSSSPYLRRAVRNSMGTIFKLPVLQLTSLGETLKELQSRYGVKSIAAHPHAKTNSVHRTNSSGDCCLVFGNEGEGISPDVLTVCDEAVAISMSKGVDSLNVASAAAVILYEVQRQRNLK